MRTLEDVFGDLSAILLWNNLRKTEEVRRVSNTDTCICIRIHVDRSIVWLGKMKWERERERSTIAEVGRRLTATRKCKLCLSLSLSLPFMPNSKTLERVSLFTGNYYSMKTSSFVGKYEGECVFAPKLCRFCLVGPSTTYLIHFVPELTDVASNIFQTCHGHRNSNTTTYKYVRESFDARRSHLIHTRLMRIE